MIQNVSQIEREFLIKTVSQNEQPVRFHGVSTAGTGIISTIDKSGLAVTILETIDGSGFSVCEHITGYFDCHGKTYAFETTVRDSKQRTLRVDVPSQLLRSLQRKYVRVRRPRDIRVVFHLANEDIVLDYPTCPEYISVEDCSGDRRFAGSTIQEIVASFKGELALKAQKSTIIMFRNRAPSSFEEKLLSATGKVLFVPSVDSPLPKSDPYPEGRIITEAIEESFEDPNFFIEGSHFGRLLAEKKTRGISSEIWCPVVYYQYVVGYIYIANREGESFDVAMVDYIWDFSRVLAYHLKKTGYFETGEDKKTAPGHAATVLDMSPGGMLISLPRSDIRTPIHEGSVFSVDISLGDRCVPCTARVIRRFDDTDTVSYGTTFINMTSSDVMTLYEFLYRKPYVANDPIAYERA